MRKVPRRRRRALCRRSWSFSPSACCRPTPRARHSPDGQDGQVFVGNGDGEDWYLFDLFQIFCWTFCQHSTYSHLHSCDHVHHVLCSYHMVTKSIDTFDQTPTKRRNTYRMVECLNVPNLHFLGSHAGSQGNEDPGKHFDLWNGIFSTHWRILSNWASWINSDVYEHPWCAV